MTGSWQIPYVQFSIFMLLPNKNNEIFFKSYIHNFVPLFKFRAPFHLICSLFQIELFLFSCSTWTDTWWTSRLNKIWRSKCLPCSGIWHEIFFVIFYKFIIFCLLIVKKFFLFYLGCGKHNWSAEKTFKWIKGSELIYFFLISQNVKKFYF